MADSTVSYKMNFYERRKFKKKVGRFLNEVKDLCSEMYSAAIVGYQTSSGDETKLYQSIIVSPWDVSWKQDFQKFLVEITKAADKTPKIDMFYKIIHEDNIISRYDSMPENEFPATLVTSILKRLVSSKRGVNAGRLAQDIYGNRDPDSLKKIWNALITLRRAGLVVRTAMNFHWASVHFKNTMIEEGMTIDEIKDLIVPINLENKL